MRAYLKALGPLVNGYREPKMTVDGVSQQVFCAIDRANYAVNSRTYVSSSTKKLAISSFLVEEMEYFGEGSQSCQQVSKRCL